MRILIEESGFDHGLRGFVGSAIENQFSSVLSVPSLVSPDLWAAIRPVSCAATKPGGRTEITGRIAPGPAPADPGARHFQRDDAGGGRGHRLGDFSQAGRDGP